MSIIGQRNKAKGRNYPMRSYVKTVSISIAALAAAVFLAGLLYTTVEAKALPRPQTWVDGELFKGVVTPATFDPANGNFDELYNCGANDGPGFKNGVPLISESKPGDRDYNGGRWHLNLPKDATVCAKYGNATTVEDLDPADFDSTDTYFECPLLPSRGGGP